MTTALARGNGYLTVADILLLELPHFDPEARELALWEFTPFPFFDSRYRAVDQLREWLVRIRGAAPTGDAKQEQTNGT